MKMSVVKIDGIVIILPMSARQPPSQMRAFVLVAALFALTLAILQPLAHAVMLRTGGPEAAAALWGAICQPTADGEAEGSGSSPAKVHDCCFGLAHTPVLLGPAVAGIFVDQVPASDRVPSRHHHPTTGAIRDGPQQPRAPPLLKD
jgi:hypothetical protein